MARMLSFSVTLRQANCYIMTSFPRKIHVSVAAMHACYTSLWIYENEIAFQSWFIAFKPKIVISTFVLLHILSDGQVTLP